ncbi:MAG: haloacid dehalogenase-like hydrolase [Candidatus Bathyarchaeota archaeon]|nr:haloacid dehalogenase-like hydrolase [Candidatus Bathyarchaeota archaeon]
MSAFRGRKTKLAVFDVEGVLVPKNRLFFETSKSLGVFPLMKALFFGLLYSTGVMPLKQALQNIFGVMKGVEVEQFYQTMEKLPIMPNASSVFATLKAEGCKTALISSGFPTFLVEDLAAKLGADYAIGVEVGIEKEALTGEVWGDVTEANGKFLVLKELMEDQKISASDCVIVADDRNNASIFLKEALKIGYEPDFVLRTKADFVVTGKLAKILPVIHGEVKTRGLPSRKDLLRECIHASGFFIPVLAILFGVPLVALFTAAVIALYTVSEFLRARGKNMFFFSAVTRHAASQSELCEFPMAPIYFAFGILLTLLFIPAPASYAGIAIFALGDSTASIFGGTISGRTLPFNHAKTVQGTVTGFFFAFLAGSVFVAPWIALVGAAVGMLVEYLPLPINDNLLIPLVTGFTLMFLV